MKILLTGGGSGGHFYPLIAVARELKKIADKEHIAKLYLYFAADNPIDSDMLADERIEFIKVPAGKFRRYLSWHYLIDVPKIIQGIILAFIKIYTLLPDIVYSKGGYAAFPILIAARILRIPVIIHESDVVPGLVNSWSGKWANRVAISFSETARYFKKNPYVALTGNPIRSQVIGGNLEEAIQTFGLEANISTLLILGGSQGAESINEAILSAINELIKKYQVIHQTGLNNFQDISSRGDVVLEKNEFRHRYHPYAFLKEGDLRNASRAASCVISRAGASAIFEIAAWGLPAILVPLPTGAQDHQRENAYAYARAGGCEVLEERNLTPHLLLSQIDQIMENVDKKIKMRRFAEAFAKLDAASLIAQEILKLGIHE